MEAGFTGRRSFVCATTTKNPTKVCLQSDGRADWSRPPAVTEDVHKDFNSQQNVDTPRFSKCRVGESES